MKKTLLTLATLACALSALPCHAAGKKAAAAPQNPEWTYLSSSKHADEYVSKEMKRDGDLVAFAGLSLVRKPIVGAFEEGAVKSIVYVSLANCAKGLHRPTRVMMTDDSFAAGQLIRDAEDDASEWKTPAAGSPLAKAVKLACQST